MMAEAGTGTRAFVALGSNLGDRAAALAQAQAMIAAEDTVLATSQVYETEPVGGPEQGAYLNAVIAVRTERTPEALLGRLLAIEAEMGRVREVHWGPRVIDLDLLAFGDARRDTPALSLPHPRLAERAFVLVPLCEVGAEWVHPVSGKSARQLLSEVSRDGVRLWSAGASG